MSRAVRLLNLLQALRRRRRPVTAGELSRELEVSVRTGPDYTSFATDGATGGFARGAPSGAGGPLMVFPVADLEGAQARVTAAGGAVTKPIFSFPGGRRFHFRDLDGYDVAAWSEH